MGFGRSIRHLGASSLIPPITGPGGIYITLASVADPRLFDPRVSDDNAHITTMGMQQTSVHVELPNATGQTGTTEPGDLFHLRQGLLLDHSGMEGVSSRITFESSGLLKQE